MHFARNARAPSFRFARAALSCRQPMAALNERDERWIVQERADGANCNNWHWTFKDVTARTKAALDERLKAVEFPPGLEGCRITSCTAIGECSVSNRKGRLFLTYELDVTLGLTMEPSGGGGDATGASLRFPDVSATEIDDLQCVLSVKTPTALIMDQEDEEIESRGSPTTLPEVRAQAVPFLTQRLRQEVLALQEELRAEHAEHAPPTVRRSRLQPLSGPGASAFAAPRLTTTPRCGAQAGPAPLHAPVPQPIPQPLKIDHAQADAAAAAASAVSAYAVKGAAARGKGAVAARAAVAAVAHGHGRGHGAGGRGGAGAGAEAEAEEGDGEEGEEDALPPPLCAALALLRRGGEPPRMLRLSNCGLRDVHLLPLIETLQVRGCSIVKGVACTRRPPAAPRRGTAGKGV